MLEDIILNEMSSFNPITLVDLRERLQKDARRLGLFDYMIRVNRRSTDLHLPARVIRSAMKNLVIMGKMDVEPGTNSVTRTFCRRQ